MEEVTKVENEKDPEEVQSNDMSEHTDNNPWAQKLGRFDELKGGKARNSKPIREYHR